MRPPRGPSRGHALEVLSLRVDIPPTLDMLETSLAVIAFEDLGDLGRVVAGLFDDAANGNGFAERDADRVAEAHPPESSHGRVSRQELE